MIHGGSDGPVEEILPIEAMRAAMQRRDGSGLDDLSYVGGLILRGLNRLVGNAYGVCHTRWISNSKVAFLCQSSALI